MSRKLARASVRRAAALVVCLTLAVACGDERQGYVPPEQDVVIAPPDTTPRDWGSLDLPAPDLPLPADVVGEDVARPDGLAIDTVVPETQATDVPTFDTSAPPPAPRTCGVTFTYEGTADSVFVAGEFNGWSSTANAMTRDGNRWTATVDGIAPGIHGYKLVVTPPPAGDNPWMVDPANPRRIFIDGDQGPIENSKLQVPDCQVPLLVLESLEKDAARGTIEAVVQVVDGADAPGITPGSVTVTMNGAPFAGATYHAGSQRLRILLTGARVPGKYSFLVQAANGRGAAQPLFLPVWLEEDSFRWEDATLYFLFVDRFANGDPSNDGSGCAGVWDAADWKGGDWKGATQKIEDGWFDDLGVNAIWITAPMDNFDGCAGGDIAGKQYASYHGYHPVSQRDPENHFGTMAEFEELVETAHAHGIRVLVDAVINHTHAEHPWVSEHGFGKSPDWFNHNDSGGPAEICGSGCGFVDEGTCPGGGCWDCTLESRWPIVCWFRDNLPDFDFHVDEAVEAATDDLVWWVQETNLDGFRVDAVKHVDDAVVLELRAELDERVETTGEAFYTVGETFTGGGDGQIWLINRYIGPHMLYGQFDFPLMWSIRGAFAQFSDGLDSLAGRLETSQTAYPDGLMSTFFGNHDMPRYLSIAKGGNLDAQNPPAQPGALEPGLDELFGKAKLAFGFLLTIPGIPLIYYGDEVGLVGAGDPDCRRMMVFDGFGVPQQASLLAFAQAVGKARRASPALRRGDLTIVERATDHLSYARRTTGDAAFVAINRASAPWLTQVSAGSLGWGDGDTVKDAVTGTSYTVSGGQVAVRVPTLAEGGVVVLVKN